MPILNAQTLTLDEVTYADRLIELLQVLKAIAKLQSDSGT
jgi:hypothetical protein